MTSWIFQGHPKKFRVDDYLYDHDLIKWTINQEHFKDKISFGDEVYIWRADGGKSNSGGIIAKGKILSHPIELMDGAHEYWIEEPDDLYGLRVEIELEDIRLNEEEGMILRGDLVKDDNVKEMRINRLRIETIYKLEPKHSKHIDYLWKSKKDLSHYSRFI